MIDLATISREDMMAAVKLDGELRFYVAYQPIWIMNYEAYGGRPDPAKWGIFRNGLYVVDDGNANEFVDTIREYEVDATNIQAIIERDLLSVSRLQILVDFDKRLYVDGTAGDELCRFVPPGWSCVEDYPMLYLSGTIYVWPQLPWPLFKPYRRHD